MNSYRRKLLLFAILNILRLTVESEVAIKKPEEFTKDYCDPGLCQNNLQHAACKAKPKHFGKDCSIDAYVVPMTNDLSTYLLTFMNYMRNKVAGGEYNNFPAASRMHALHWHEELAHLAEVNVRKCNLHRDLCRNTKDFKNVGQTVAYRGLKGIIPSINVIAQTQVKTWLNENILVTMKEVMNHTRSHGKPTENFQQLFYENVSKVGCAMLQQTKNNWLQTYLTCNFDHAPIVGQPIYAFGRPGEACKPGLSEFFAKLCDSNEEVDLSPTDIEIQTQPERRTVQVNATKAHEKASKPQKEKESIKKSSKSAKGPIRTERLIKSDSFKKIVNKLKEVFNKLTGSGKKGKEKGKQEYEDSLDDSEVRDKKKKGKGKKKKEDESKKKEEQESEEESDERDKKKKGKGKKKKEDESKKKEEQESEEESDEPDHERYRNHKRRNLEDPEAMSDQEAETTTKSPEEVHAELQNRFEHFLHVLSRSARNHQRYNITIVTSNHEVDVEDKKPEEDDELSKRQQNVRKFMRTRHEPAFRSIAARRTKLAVVKTRTKHRDSGVAKWIAVRR